MAWFWHRQRQGHACPRTIRGAQHSPQAVGPPMCPAPMAQPSCGEKPMARQLVPVLEALGVPEPAGAAKGSGPCGLSGA